MNYFEYNQYIGFQKEEAENKEKYKNLLARLDVFKDVKTLSEAQELASKHFPTNQEITRFYVGNAKCVVVNKPELLRISVDSSEEFICYDFS